MPPVKSRLAASIDSDILQEIEAEWRRRVVEAGESKSKRRIPSYSSVVQEILQRGLRDLRAGGPPP